MAQLTSKFDILRGWPHASAVAEEFLLPTVDAANDNIHEGDWVRLNPVVGKDYTVLDELRAGKNAIAQTDAATNNEELWGLVIEGRQEKSVTSIVKKVTVLIGGGYVARFWNDPDHPDNVLNQWDDASAFLPGRPVTLALGQIKEVAAAGASSTLTVFGHVLKKDAANGTLDVYISL